MSDYFVKDENRPGDPWPSPSHSISSSLATADDSKPILINGNKVTGIGDGTALRMKSEHMNTSFSNNKIEHEEEALILLNLRKPRVEDQVNDYLPTVPKLSSPTLSPKQPSVKPISSPNNGSSLPISRSKLVPIAPKSPVAAAATSTAKQSTNVSLKLPALSGLVSKNASKPLASEPTMVPKPLTPPAIGLATPLSPLPKQPNQQYSNLEQVANNTTSSLKKLRPIAPKPVVLASPTASPKPRIYVNNTALSGINKSLNEQPLVSNPLYKLIAPKARPVSSTVTPLPTLGRVLTPKISKPVAKQHKPSLVTHKQRPSHGAVTKRSVSVDKPHKLGTKSSFVAIRPRIATSTSNGTRRNSHSRSTPTRPVAALVTTHSVLDSAPKPNIDEAHRKVANRTIIIPKH